MPTNITRAPHGTEQNDLGIGGRPPTHLRPTGGGGDGENEGDHPERRRPRTHGALLHHYKALLLTAFAVDLAVCTLLLIAYATQHRAGAQTADPLTVPPVLWASTAMLLFSALTMEIARQQMYREFDVMEEWFGLGRPTVRHAAPWIVATLALGISFLAGQHTAWPHLRMQGVGAIHGPGSGWGASVFPVLVATHEVHLLLGALALVVILPVLLIVRHTEARQGIVNYAAYYWYGMVAAWSLLFGWMLLAR